MQRYLKLLIIAIFSLVQPVTSFAGEVIIEKVTFNQLSQDSYRFSVTLRHDDTGWDHYADEWQVIDLENNILGSRILAHPHVHEQPFTRSSSPITIPLHIETVHIRAKDNVDGWAQKTYKVKIR